MPGGCPCSFGLVGKRGTDQSEQLGWVVPHLQQMQRLVNTVHARAAHSPAINDWHTGFHALTEGMFRTTLEQSGIDHAGIDAEIKIGVFVVERLLTHDLDDVQQQKICERLAAQWTRP